MTAINRGFFISAAISAIGVAVATFTFLPQHFSGLRQLRQRHPYLQRQPRWIALGTILMGIVLASAIQCCWPTAAEGKSSDLHDRCRPPGPRT